MKFLFLFMDGVGLGVDDEDVNPFVKAKMPNLSRLLGGKKLVSSSLPVESDRASLVGLDAELGVAGLPQSATGQAALLTGKNVSEAIGKHYGPKPNPAVQEVMKDGSLFSELKQRGYKSALLNSYPQAYFDAIKSGRRMYSAIPLAVTNAGIKLKTAEDLYDGNAISADFTGEGWREFFKDDKSPLMDAHEAGRFLGKLAMKYDLAFFEYWPSDYAGHKQNEERALTLLDTFDGVLGGLLDVWEDDSGLILITSDHGNLEDLSTRRHTANLVPALVIGSKELRRQFLAELTSIVDVTPAILKFYDGSNNPY